MPEFGYRGPHKSIYPWGDMLVGDSFVPNEKTSRQSAHNIARQASKRLAPKKFRAFTSMANGARIWRVE